MTVSSLLTTFWRMAMPQWACSTWLEGMGFIIEKAFQKGRDVLNEADVRVESLAIIDSLENCTITIR